MSAMLKPQDMSRIILLGTPAVHPCDQERVVLAKTQMSLEQDAYLSRLVVYHTGTGAEEPLLPDAEQGELPQDHSPKWSPDGTKLGFLRKVRGVDELWVYHMEERTAERLTPEVKVKEYVFSPDGRKVVYTSRVNDVNSTAYRITRLRYKFDGEGMTNGYVQLFLLDLETGEVQQLTTRRSDHHTPVFTPDGRKLYYVSDYPEDDDRDKFPTIHVRDLAAGEETSFRPAVKSISALYPAADGSLMGIGKRHIAESTELDKWFRINLQKEETIWLDHLPELHIGSHLISDSKRPGAARIAAPAAGGEAFLFLATEQGLQALYLFKVKEEKVARIPLPLNVIAFDLASYDEQEIRFVFVGDSMRRPGELYHAVWRYGEKVEITALTDDHASFAAALPPAEIREYRVRSKDGLEIQGWSMTPMDEQGEPVQRKGTQLWIHGGPHLACGSAFHYDFWYWVSLGYRVLCCNPRGSTGYGQAFARAVVGDWGGGDVEDLFGFLEKVLAEEGRDEGEPLYLLGGSYGGYLVNWIIAHDHRFRAAVTERSICNLYSKIGSSDNGFYNNLHQLGGTMDLWTDEQAIMARSPIRYAPQVETPVLIIHAEQDHRCPIEQAEQWYIALKRLGKETAFLRLPGASHAYVTAGKPQQRAARLQAIEAWLAEYR